MKLKEGLLVHIVCTRRFAAALRAFKIYNPVNFVEPSARVQIITYLFKSLAMREAFKKIGERGIRTLGTV